MNAMTSMSHAQVLLPPRIMSLYDQDDGLVRPSELNWSSLYQWLNTQTWRRMVKRKQDGELDTIVICGFFRIVKHKATQRVFMQRKSVRLDAKNNPEWSWVNTTYYPDFMLQSVQQNLVWRFRSVLEYTIKALLNDLAKQGVVSIVAPVASSKQQHYDGVDPRSVKWAYLGMTKLASQWVSEQLGKQLNFLEHGIIQGGRSLYKHLWDFVDRERLSFYMQIHQFTLSQVSFQNVTEFTQLALDDVTFKMNIQWLPWLSILRGNQHLHYQHPDLFSYDYLRAHLPGEVSKKAMRKINRQPRQVQALLIKTRMWSPAELALVNAIQDYPTSIKVRILNDIHQRKESGVFRERHRGGQRLNDADFQRYQRVVFRWAQYFKNMIGHVKVRKHREQWQRALRQFDDVLSWIDRESITVHKNQTWYALMQRHDNWIAEINARAEAQDAEQDETTWQAAKWTPFDSKGVHIEEITLGKRLREEGQEMEHCVFSYLWDCSQQRYRVFSLQSKTERVTLGLHVDPITHRCRYDQLRGRQNAAASNAMEQVGKRLIKHLNNHAAKN